MIRYPQVVSALFTALPKRRQGGAELRFGPRGSSRHSFAPLFKTSQLYHFSLHPVSRKAFRSAKNLGWQTRLEKDFLQSREIGSGILAKAELLATRLPPRGELLTHRVPRLRILPIQCAR